MQLFAVKMLKLWKCLATVGSLGLLWLAAVVEANLGCIGDDGKPVDW